MLIRSIIRAFTPRRRLPRAPSLNSDDPPCTLDVAATVATVTSDTLLTTTEHFATPATSPLSTPQQELPPTPSAVSRTGLLEHEQPIMQRKIWVKRPGAATNATQVTVNDDDLVDTVRDVILRKYANSLGKAIDSPDVTLRIVARDQPSRQIPTERDLSPDEPIGYTLDQYYPGGQAIAEALIIDVPEVKTPRKSPRINNNYHSYAPPYPYLAEHLPPMDQAREYFPVMPTVSSPHRQHPPPHAGPVNGMLLNPANAIRPLPSPGSRSSRYLPKRPTYGRTHTTSPTVIHGSQAHLGKRSTNPGK